MRREQLSDGAAFKVFPELPLSSTVKLSRHALILR